MIQYAYLFKNCIKYGILNSDNENELENCIPKGSYFWNLNKLEEIGNKNYSGVGKSELMLEVENDAENS